MSNKINHMHAFRKIKPQYLVLCLAILSVFAVSCDNDAVAIPGDILIGTWDLNQIELNNCVDNSRNGAEMFDCTDANCTSLEFRRDGTLISTDLINGIEEIQEGTYEVDGNLLTLTLSSGRREVPFSSIADRLSFLERENDCSINTLFIRR